MDTLINSERGMMHMQKAAERIANNLFTALKVGHIETISVHTVRIAVLGFIAGVQTVVTPDAAKLLSPPEVAMLESLVMSTLTRMV